MALGGGSTAASSKIIKVGGVEIDANLYKQRASEHFNNKVLAIDDVDKQVWDLTTNVPRVGKPVAIVCAILNFVIPGLGTLVAACSAQENVSKTQMAIALIQFLTAVFLIGFIFAQYWSYLLVTKALEDQNQVNNFAKDPRMGSGAMDGASMGSRGFAGGPIGGGRGGQQYNQFDMQP